jgi:hypothetical protein
MTPHEKARPDLIGDNASCAGSLACPLAFGPLPLAVDIRSVSVELQCRVSAQGRQVWFREIV